MNLKASLSRLLQERTPDEEERATTPSEDLRLTGDPQKVENDDGHTAQSGETADADDQDSEQDQDDAQELQADLNSQPGAGLRGPRRILHRIWSILSPSPSEEEEIQAYVPHYRILPIVSGIAIPFSILLEIPGLTEEWYTRTDGSVKVASKPNPPLLVIGITLSILCAVMANVCLIIRFLERRIRTMTILCILFLSIHDAINVAALSAFGATRGDSSYTQAFWMTLCSTIVSAFTNVTLIIDLIRISDFERSGSGLTRRQRSLVIIIIGLFCYLALGALVNAILLDLTFLNALYFTVVTIETIGFGDIVPDDRSSRVFICFYATLGVINIAFVVGYVREALMEGLDFGYRRRLLAIQERRRAAHRRRRAENRWKHAIIWRLRGRRATVWIPEETNDHKHLWSKLNSAFWRACWGLRLTSRRSTHETHGRHGMKLNLWALPRCQLEAAALEAGVPLSTLLPEDFYDTYDQDMCHTGGCEHHHLPLWLAVHPVYHRRERPTESLTHQRLAGMAAIITKLGLSIYESGGNPLPEVQDASIVGEAEPQDSFGSLQARSTMDYRADVTDTEKKAYYTRSGLSWGWFLIFWMGGAAIFKATEDWTYGLSIYFCFISFSTIGYGDLTPTTPAGRSIFIVWALVGVATMTIFISVISEAYTSRYKGILGRNSFKRIVRQYQKRTRVELSEKVQHLDVSPGKLRQEMPDREETGFVEHESPPASTIAPDDAALTAPSTSQPDRHVEQAQQSLERLPHQVLTATRSIQQYMQLIGDWDGRSADTERSVEESIWSLVDDVMGERKLTQCTKMDILKDGEARQTLMMLGIERSLRELVDIAEQAVTAIRERDQTIATLEREKEEDVAETERRGYQRG